MSFVEKNLEKQQRAQQATAASYSDAGIYGSVVTSTQRTLDANGAPSNIQTRSVHINLQALRAAGLLPPEHQERLIAKQYRQIKRPLIANAMGRGTAKLPGGHFIVMASALPGEGKTFTCMNLAFSMSLEKDLRVVLVDGDVAKPHISKLFGIEAEPGLLDVLRDPQLDIEQCILRTNVQGLYVLPSGKPSENATELLASARMEDIARRLGERDPQRIVLCDSPPLLLTTESQALAQAAGQIVVVVRAGETPHQAVLDALSHLVETKSIGLVLNQSRSEASGGYYYGYGIYGDNNTGGRRKDSQPG